MGDPKPLDLGQVRSSISGGGLEFDKQALDSALRSCTEILETLTSVSSKSEALTKISGLDGFESSRALSAGLGDLAGRSAGGFQQAVNEHVKTVEALRTSLESAGRAYFRTESEAQQHFAAIRKNADHIGRISNDQWATTDEVIADYWSGVKVTVRQFNTSIEVPGAITE